MTEHIRKFFSLHFGVDENTIGRSDLISLAKTLKEAENDPAVTFISNVADQDQDAHPDLKVG